MTPVERLQAAIQKLEQLHDSVSAEHFARLTYFAGGPSLFSEYMLTLHRTLDAQLALLREALEFSENSQAIGMGHDELEEYYGNVRALADAILGGDS